MMEINNEWTFSLESFIKEKSTESQGKLTELKHLCESQNDKVVEFSENIEKKSLEAIADNENLGTWANMHSDNFISLSKDNLENNLSNKQTMSSEITDYSNDILSKFSERMGEIETFFTENIKKDERTGKILFEY